MFLILSFLGNFLPISYAYIEYTMFLFRWIKLSKLMIKIAKIAKFQFTYILKSIFSNKDSQ